MTLKLIPKLYIAEHKGMVGTAVWSQPEVRHYTHLFGKIRQKLDLPKQALANNFVATNITDSNIIYGCMGRGNTAQW